MSRAVDRSLPSWTVALVFTHRQLCKQALCASVCLSWKFVNEWLVRGDGPVRSPLTKNGMGERFRFPPIMTVIASSGSPSARVNRFFHGSVA